jgi:FAD:protein FMN transferase
MPDPSGHARSAARAVESRPASPGAASIPDSASTLDLPAGDVPAWLHRHEAVMGTVVSIDVRDPSMPPEAMEAAFAHLHDVDRRFSPFRTDSEVSRLGRGDLLPADASEDVSWVMGLCDELARLTDGYFDARRFRADGMPDPTGVVKGWAVEEAAFILLDAGATNFHVNGGGDIVARGSPVPGSGRPWRIGIRHPGQRDRVATVIEARDQAVATSGTYERGEHVVDPHTGQPATELVSLTVVGSSLTYADAFATAALAMGRRGPAWIAGLDGYEAFAVTADGMTLSTPGLVVAPPPDDDETIARAE